MARINIEDSLFRTHRFQKLMIRLGSADAALGAIVRAWMIAQRYWIPDKKFIPKEIWEAEELSPEIIACRLAEECDGGIYVCGAEEQFAWLLQKVEAGRKGGQASAESRSSSAQAERTLEPSVAEASLERSEPSSLSSLFSSLSSPSLSHAPIFAQRLESLPERERMRETQSFERLVKQYGDRQEVLAVIESVVQRGKDLRGNLIVSFMGYLEKTFLNERDHYRELQSKKRNAEEARTVREQRDREKQARQEQSDRELIQHELAFQEAFPDEDSRQKAIEHYSVPIRPLAAPTAPAARAYAVEAWWKEHHAGVGA